MTSRLPLRSGAAARARAAARLAIAVTTAVTTACAGSTSSEPTATADRIVVASPGNGVTLAFGGSAEIGGTDQSVRFDRVLNDSRCPTKALVQCVWAGSVQIRLQVSPTRGMELSHPRVLETVAGRDTTRISGRLVQLVRVLPERELLDSIPMVQYRAVLRVVGAP